MKFIWVENVQFSNYYPLILIRLWDSWNPSFRFKYELDLWLLGNSTFKSIRNSKRRNKGNFMSKSN